MTNSVNEHAEWNNLKNDLESRRHQLLEARQQLEQARAEIQVAICQRPESALHATAFVHNGDHDSSGWRAANRFEYHS